jgi:hypothetical protein
VPGRAVPAVPHDLVEKAVAHHISPDWRWILLYVRRWLRAPLAQPNGTLVARDRATPQSHYSLQDRHFRILKRSVTASSAQNPG